jgi:carbohydrate kinase (thermoresistant glucokinase family)
MIVVMGVAGSGKTTVGKKLSVSLDCPFYEGDDFHTSANIEKMKKGMALTDEDREPWIELLSEMMGQWRKQSPTFVLACSALKAKYRRILETTGKVRWIFLKGSYDLVLNRLSEREGHFFPAQLLQSQFQDLEEPGEALTLDIAEPVDKIIETVRNQLGREK